MKNQVLRDYILGEGAENLVVKNYSYLAFDIITDNSIQPGIYP
ncbi:MAG: hypothetical protein Q4P28_01965 [Tissierellia bacterium]|nr:hypothetical protein [Tissierellia bacterium]